MFCIQKSRMAHRDSWLKISKDWNRGVGYFVFSFGAGGHLSNSFRLLAGSIPCGYRIEWLFLAGCQVGRSWVPREHLYSFSCSPFHLQTSKLSPACSSNLSEFLSTTNLSILRSHVIRATQLFPCIKVDCAR